jgi:hypothetical protein
LEEDLPVIPAGRFQELRLRDTEKDHGGVSAENYPDDFNDFVESSEYVALIDLIAYIAQALSFRVDLNARENFLETAERRNSVLRLARLINYNAKRNKPATGLLKD